MKNILIPSDFSPQARHAIRYAAHMFAHSLESLVILNALFNQANNRHFLIQLDDILKIKAERGLAEDYRFAKEVLSNPEVQVKTIANPIRWEDALAEVLRIEPIDLVLLPAFSTPNGTNGQNFHFSPTEVVHNFKVPVMSLPAI